MTIKILRFITGEDIIAGVHMEKEDVDGIDFETGFVTVINPLKILYLPTQDGHLSISLMHWFFPKVTETNVFSIHENNILVMVKPNKQLVKNYIDSQVYFSNNVDTIYDKDISVKLQDGEGTELLKDFLDKVKKDKKK